jgi:hypothetical protein
MNRGEVRSYLKSLANVFQLYTLSNKIVKKTSLRLILLDMPSIHAVDDIDRKTDAKKEHRMIQNDSFSDVAAPRSCWPSIFFFGLILIRGLQDIVRKADASKTVAWDRAKHLDDLRVYCCN